MIKFKIISNSFDIYYTLGKGYEDIEISLKFY